MISPKPPKNRESQDLRPCLGGVATLPALCLFFALSAPLAGQGFSAANASSTAQIVAEAEAEESPRLAAAGWCIAKASPEPESEDEPAAEGCDVGIGLALQRFGRASLVAVLGAQTTGVGLAWRPRRGGEGPVIAIAIGVVLRYDAGGIYINSAAPAVGATLSFAGRRR